MSTATYERPLYAVPNVPPSTKARFASLLALRDAAYRAFDEALSPPRSAIRWAIDLFHRWVEATGSLGVLSWVSARTRDAADLFRTVGPCLQSWRCCLRHRLLLQHSGQDGSERSHGWAERSASTAGSTEPARSSPPEHRTCSSSRSFPCQARARARSG